MIEVKDAQKPDHISLGTLIGHLKEGRFVIPDFQREFEWQPWDIRDLMRSIFLDYYIGSLLLWRGKEENFRALVCEPIYGYEGDRNDAQHIVLDGQQRLTAMYYTFVAPNVPAPNRANRYLYFIQVQRFMEMAYDEAFRYDWTRGGLNLLANTRAQYQNHMFPSRSWDEAVGTSRTGFRATRRTGARRHRLRSPPAIPTRPRPRRATPTMRGRLAST